MGFARLYTNNNMCLTSGEIKMTRGIWSAPGRDYPLVNYCTIVHHRAVLSEDLPGFLWVITLFMPG